MGFAAGGLLMSFVVQGWQKRRYAKNPPYTTLEILGGSNLTLLVKHEGLPVKARVRVQLQEFGDDMDAHHPEPYDVHLQTRTHGGSYRSIKVSDAFDIAKATLASVTTLQSNPIVRRFSVHIPGMDEIGCVIQEGMTCC